MHQPLPGPVAAPFALAHLTSRQGLRATRNYIHNGVDLVKLDAQGRPTQGGLFYPIAPGVVEEICPSGSVRCSGYGNGVLVRHGPDMLSWYAHADNLLVQPGDEVWPLVDDPTGDHYPTPLGTIGVTYGTPRDPERTLGVPHVHLEIVHDGWPFAALDVPARYDVIGTLAASGVGSASGYLSAGLEPFEYSEPGYIAALDSIAKGATPRVRIAPPEYVRRSWVTATGIVIPLLVALVGVLWPRGETA